MKEALHEIVCQEAWIEFTVTVVWSLVCFALGVFFGRNLLEKK